MSLQDVAESLVARVAESLIGGFVPRLVQAIQIDPTDLRAWQGVERQLLRQGAPDDSLMMMLAVEHFVDTLRQVPWTTQIEMVLHEDSQRGGVAEEFIRRHAFPHHYLSPLHADEFPVSHWYLFINPRRCDGMIVQDIKPTDLNDATSIRPNREIVIWGPPEPISMWGHGGSPKIPGTWREGADELVEIERRRLIANAICSDHEQTSIHEFAVVLQQFLNRGLCDDEERRDFELDEQPELSVNTHDPLYWANIAEQHFACYDELLWDLLALSSAVMERQSFVLREGTDIAIVAYQPGKRCFGIVPNPKELIARAIQESPNLPELAYRMTLLRGDLAEELFWPLGNARYELPKFSSHVPRKSLLRRMSSEFNMDVLSYDDTRMLIGNPYQQRLVAIPTTSRSS